jgi:hypothetical protein
MERNILDKTKFSTNIYETIIDWDYIYSPLQNHNIRRWQIIRIGNNLSNQNKVIYSCDRPWRPIGLWDVEVPIFFRQSAHRWRWGCQPYEPTALYTPTGKIPDTYSC